jgi:beta-glucanase (GH16 family)
MNILGSILYIAIVSVVTVVTLGKVVPLSATAKPLTHSPTAVFASPSDGDVMTGQSKKTTSKEVNALTLHSQSKDTNDSNKSQVSANIQSNIFASVPSWAQDYTGKPNGSIDVANWNIMLGNNNGWGNSEVENYTGNTENLRIQDGALTIEAKKINGVYTSGRITTENKFDFMYGKIDIVAKLPTGKGIWPAVWFWPTDTKYSNESVTSAESSMAWLNNGEIDLIEGSAWGDSDFTGSLHSLEHYPGHNVRTGKVTVSTASSVYHTYSLAWTPTSLDLMVDNVSFKHIVNSGVGFTDWPYNQHYHLILNVAMGGAMSEGLVSAQYPLGIDDSGAPWKMSVKSITYYPLAG